MKTVSDLNEKEKEVLTAVGKAILWETGGEFGHADETKKRLPSLSMNQVKGYLSQLSQKGYLSICEETSQLGMTKKGNDFYGGNLFEIY